MYNLVDQVTELDSEVVSDDNTVWVNGIKGECLGRFSKWGIDVHRSIDEQMEGKGQCLFCTHTKPDSEAWIIFVKAIFENFGIVIADEHRPLWLGA